MARLLGPPTNYRANGINRTVSVVTACAPDAFKINLGTWSTEPSDWAVAEIIVYNSTLSDADVITVENYLMAKYLTAVPSNAAFGMVGSVFQKLYGRTSTPLTRLSALYRDNGAVTTNATSVPAYGSGTPIGLSHAKNLYRNPLLFRLTADSAKGYLTGNATVGTWYDELGTYNATSSGAPTYRYSYINFSGVSDYMTLPTLTLKYQNHLSEGINGFTVVVVAQFNGNNYYERLFDFGVGANNDNILMCRAANSNSMLLQIRNGGTVVATVSCDNVIDNRTHVWTGVVDNVALTMKLYMDGFLMASSTYTTVITNKTLTTNYIGTSNWSNDGLFNGYIYSLDWYTQPLNDAELLAMHTRYLSKTFTNSSDNVLLNPGLMVRTLGTYFSDNPQYFWTNAGNTREALTNDITNLFYGTLGIRAVNDPSAFSVEWVGYFLPTTTGTWTFYLASDDAGYLWLGNNAYQGWNFNALTTSTALINNGGGHGVVEQSGTAYLTKGVAYMLRIQYGNGGGACDCQFSFAPPGGSRTYDGTGLFFNNYAFYDMNCVLPRVFAGLVYRRFNAYANDDVNYYGANACASTGGASRPAIDFTSIATATGGTVAAGATNTSIEWLGWFNAPWAGTWTFSLGSVDGSFLWLGNTAIGGYTAANANINNGGAHAFTTKTCTVTLDSQYNTGYQTCIRVQWCRAAASASSGGDFVLSVTPPNGTATTDLSRFVSIPHGRDQFNPAISARVLRALGSPPDGDYYFVSNNATSYAMSANQMYVNFSNSARNTGDNAWVLVQRGRESTTFWAEAGQNSGNLVSGNLATNTPVASMPAAWIDRMVNGWQRTRLMVNRTLAADSYVFAGTQTASFAWANFNATPSPVTATATYYPSVWGAGTGTVACTSATSWTDTSTTGNDVTRTFTWTWASHGGYQGWSHGLSWTAGYQYTTEQHGIDRVNVYLEL